MIKILGNTKGTAKWLVIACLLAVALGVSFIGLNQWSTTQDKYIAQANAETLAQDIAQVCDREGVFVMNNRDLCAKGDAVLDNPTEVIPGPKGEKGDKGDRGEDGKDGTNGTNGIDGKNGVDGKDGADSTVPGPNGVDGKDGLNGANGVDGLNGANGTNGVDGKDGLNGADGADGKDGQSVTYFTWTDPKTGQKYNCNPEPEGSSTFVCTAESPALKTTP